MRPETFAGPDRVPKISKCHTPFAFRINWALGAAEMTVRVGEQDLSSTHGGWEMGAVGGLLLNGSGHVEDEAQTACGFSEAVPQPKLFPKAMGRTAPPPLITDTGSRPVSTRVPDVHV